MDILGTERCLKHLGTASSVTDTVRIKLRPIMDVALAFHHKQLTFVQLILTFNAI